MRHTLPSLFTLADALRLLHSHIHHEPIEILQVLFLTPDGSALAHHVHSFGTANQTWMSVNTIVNQATSLGATAIILAHNHPNGNLHPSPEDRRSTQRLASAAAAHGIQLVDHFILTNDGHRSMKTGVEVPDVRRSGPCLGW